MLEENYLRSAPERVRIKLVHVRNARPDVVLSNSEVEGLLEAFVESRRRASTEFYPVQFEALNPTPVVAVVDAEKLKRLNKLIKQRTGRELYDAAAVIEVDGEKYIIAVEHHCG
ncbi:MAG: hypothetical protein QXX19_07970 [Candidatus Caldarchaeum sp.]